MADPGDRYRLGIAALDDQHAQLLGLFVDLQACVGAGARPADLALLFELVAAELAEHCATEERLMLESAFPGLPAHRDDHDAIQSTLAALVRRNARGAPPSALLLGSLVDWFRGHISGSDRAYVPFLVAPIPAEQR